MPIYTVRVIYHQTFEHTVHADDEEEAKQIAENMEHVGDGDYHLYDTEIAHTSYDESDEAENDED